MTEHKLPTFADVKAAAQRLKGIVHHTPIMTSSTLDKFASAKIFLKCENFQRVGAFKFRGAYNALSQLSAEEKKQGVVTHSSGNHAQGIALAAKLLDIKATIVMPNNAPKSKIAATRGYGAEIVEYDPELRTREEISAELAQKHGYTLIPPYDHFDIIAGQGTAAYELLSDIPDLDFLLTPCGGGGLLSGSALAAKGLNPNVKVYGVEPEVADDATRSFHTKTLHRVKNPPTIADGVRTPYLGKLTFPLVISHVDEMVTVTEKSIVLAVQFLFSRTKLVVEPSGVLGVSALLTGKFKLHGKVGIILSGGNVDEHTMAEILNS